MNIFTPDVLKSFTKKAPELRQALNATQLELVPSRKPPFPSLCVSVLYQQLSLKAAQTIQKRLMGLVGDLTPRSVLMQSPEDLRSVGLSRQKASYLHNIAEAFSEDGSLAGYSDAASLDSMETSEITAKFTDIKGVGEWTAQMYLIFGLGRLDVLAFNDLGVRNGIQLMCNLEELPKPSYVKKIGQLWQPFATVGTCLAWAVVRKSKG